jgi:hypothetical protein
MSKKILPILLFIGGLSLFFGTNVSLVSCNKPNNDTAVTPPPPPLPPPPPPVVNRVDVYRQGTPTGYAGSWVFTYDNLKRVTRIADNFSMGVLNDTVYYFFEYDGNNTKPSRMRSHQINNPLTPGNPLKDTVFFTYDVSGRLLSDQQLRAEEIASSTSYVRRPRIRNYSYNGNQVIVNWSSIGNGETQLKIYRTDSLTITDGNITEWIGRVPHAHLLGNGGHGGFRVRAANSMALLAKNPLATLNIGTTPFLWLTKRAEIEIMGNWTYTAYWNSTVLPDIFDFTSANIMGSVNMQNYYPDGTYLGLNSFSITTPVVNANGYPSSYIVGPTGGPFGGFSQEYRLVYQ